MLKYLEDQFLYEYRAKVEAIKQGTDGRDIIVLNDTIFYPKGGGQPNDIGEIKKGENLFEVLDVRMVDNEIHHIGQYKSGKMQVGDEVEIKIDEAKRKEYSAIHSAGHLIDEAMFSLGYYKELKPSKAFHYPEGPSVEFSGNLTEYNLEEVKQQVLDEINKMILAGYEAKFYFIDPDEVDTYCHKVTIDEAMIQKNKEENKKIRVVVMWGNKGVTCAGTHVKNINEIKGVEITKLTNKKNKVKVSYKLV